MVWTPSLKQLEIISLTARFGNLTRVAAALNVTQPAVSHSLREMERQLGYSLFVRDRNGLQPTKETVKFLPEAERLQEQLTKLGAYMHQLGGGKNRELRIATLNSISATLIPRALQAFRADHSNVKVTALVASGAEIGEMVQQHEVDCAIVYGPSTSPLRNSIPLLETEVASFSPPSGGPSRQKTGLRIADLAEGAVILPTMDTVLGDIVRQGITAGAMLRLSTIEVNSAFSAIGLVKEGLGIALVDPLLVSHAHSRGLRIRRLDPSIVLRVDLLLGRAQGDRSPVQDFLPYLRAATDVVAQQLQRASIHARLC